MSRQATSDPGKSDPGKSVPGKGNAAKRKKGRAIPQQQFNDSVFRSLLEVSRSYQAMMMRLLQSEYGHDSLTLAFEGVMRSVPREGIRHGDLARKLGRKKQNIGPLLKAVEKAGYIRIAEDRSDKRAKCVWLTDAGVQLIAEGVEVTERINEVIGQLLGGEAFLALKCALQALNVSFSPDATHTPVESPAGFIANLIQLSDYSSNRLYQYLREHNHKSFKPAHGNIFVHFGYENQRITSIAKAQDVSKQAIAKLVYEMEEEGYLTTVPDA
ncbi:MAG: winged helix DNA-binding protein [Pseudomonadales bacterium]|nr:winged helix DNA-binding protein [Pseudomonadales bacterium]